MYIIYYGKQKNKQKEYDGRLSSTYTVKTRCSICYRDINCDNSNVNRFYNVYKLKTWRQLNKLSTS